MLDVATDPLLSGSDHERVVSARLAANRHCGSAVRLRTAEDVRTGRELTDETVQVAADVAGDELEAEAILRNKEASAEHRRTLFGPYVRRSVGKAADG